MISLQKELSDKLNNALFIDEDILSLQNEIDKEKSILIQQAQDISERRKEAAPLIENFVQETLANIGMPDAQLKVDLQVRSNQTFDGHGIDNIKFLFTANKGHQLNELHKVASGGELSRLMLSIKSLIAKKTALPTIIFDEIDTGVSGEVAHKVGNIMEQLAQNMQVITITHLPQMASKGNSHFFVYKEVKDGLTYSQIKRLSQSERVTEIAKMLSGENPGESAFLNAKELLKLN